MAEYRAFPNVPARNLLQGGVEIPLMTRGLDIELVQGDLRALPFPMASFDLVIDFGTCYHVSRPDDALREIASVLAPGGVFAHETRVSQALAHPVHAGRRRLPWRAAPRLSRERMALLWATETVV